MNHRKQGTKEMIQKGVLERLIAAGLNREQAEVALLIADGVKMAELKKMLGFRAIQHVSFLKTVIGPPSQIKALVESCKQLMLLEEEEEKHKEEFENGYLRAIRKEEI